MPTDSILKQLEQWKDKYYQAVNDKKQQEKYCASLEKGLGRLALASQGQDKNLDIHIEKLRESLRKSTDQQALDTILKNIERAIVTMEESRQNSSNTTSNGTILAQMLGQLNPPKSQRQQIKKLIAKAQNTDHNTIDALVSEIGQYLDSIITEQKKSSGFSLFRRANLTKKTETFASNSSPIENPLLRLLERLSLPPDISSKANKLREKLSSNMSPEDLPALIEDLADLINNLGTQVIHDKQEYGDFLQNLAQQIEALDEHLRDNREDEQTAFDQRQELGQRVTTEVSNIREQVDDAADLEELKLNLEDRLEHLAQHVEDYRNADLERHTKATKQISSLSHRLSHMEQEAQALREAIRKSREMALKDALTGIWNRQAFNDALSKEFARWQRYRKPLTLVMWDIDWFKRINDTYGHAAGDKALQAIAHIFQRATRNTDFIARYGGEEFVGLFPETSLSEALIMANNLRQQIERSEFHYEKKPISITASAGLASFEADDDTTDSVLKKADTALYKAKETRNSCVAL